MIITPAIKTAIKAIFYAMLVSMSKNKPCSYHSYSPCRWSWPLSAIVSLLAHCEAKGSAMLLHSSLSPAALPRLFPIHPFKLQSHISGGQPRDLPSHYPFYIVIFHLSPGLTYPSSLISFYYQFLPTSSLVGGLIRLETKVFFQTLSSESFKFLAFDSISNFSLIFLICTREGSGSPFSFFYPAWSLS